MKKQQQYKKMAYGNTEGFNIRVGVHQGSVLRNKRNLHTGLPWELLYADDLALLAEGEEEFREKLIKWKDCLEAKGMKVNIGKTT